MNLFRSLILVSSMTFLSRILGFIRDVMFARVFGVDMASDAFFVAFKIPNLLRRIFAEGAFSQAFIPVLIEYKNNEDSAEIRMFISYIAGLLILVLTIITMIGMLSTSWIINIIAQGFITTPEKFALSTSLLRIMFPYILLISITALVGAILNAWNYFAMPAFAPTLLNISMIGFTMLAPSLFHPPIIALAWAVIIGGILQLSCQLPCLKKIGMLVLPKIQICNVGIWRVLKHMGPAIIGVSVNQLSLIFNTTFASFLVSGSISWIYYADRLMEFPSGIIGVALWTILLPALSNSYHSGNYDEYASLLDWGLRLCFILVLPSAVILGILSYPLIVALFQYGKFSSFDVIMTQRSLIAYSIGLIGLIIVKVLAAGFYSRHDTKTPVRVAIITLFITQLMNLTFINSLKHAGLSLSVSLSACLNAILLYWQLRRQNLFIPQPGWLMFFFQVLIALISMSAILSWLIMIINDWSQGNMFCRMLRLIGVIITGYIVYFSVLSLTGLRLRQFVRSILQIRQACYKQDKR